MKSRYWLNWIRTPEGSPPAMLNRRDVPETVYVEVVAVVEMASPSFLESSICFFGVFGTIVILVVTGEAERARRGSRLIVWVMTWAIRVSSWGLAWVVVVVRFPLTMRFLSPFEVVWRAVSVDRVSWLCLIVNSCLGFWPGVENVSYSDDFWIWSLRKKSASVDGFASSGFGIWARE